MNISNYKERNGKLSIISKIGVFSMSLLTVVSAVYIYSPIIGSHATTDAQLEVRTTINPVISLTLDTSSLAFSMNPTSTGAFESKSVIVTVDTNSSGGYELYFSSMDDETSMKNTNPSVTYAILSDFDDTVTSSTMPINKWGYSLDNTSFLKIPALSSQAVIKNLDHFPEGNETNTAVNVGMKISTSLPSGVYTKNLVFSALAHATPPVTLHSISNMQDISPAICDATTTPSKDAHLFDWDGSHYGDTNYVPRVSLKDTRDNKYYLVSKLADGNCWMSQNLELDIVAGEPIVAAKLDGTTTTVIPDISMYSIIGQPWNSNDDNVWRSYKPSADEAYYQNGQTKSSTPSGEGVTYDWEKAGYIYNWYAAAAGTGTDVMYSGETPKSICPRGWRLPPFSGNKSYTNLLSTTYGSWSWYNTPLNFPNAGYYTPHNYSNGDRMSNQGSNGYYWYATATSDVEANYIGYYISGTSTQGRTGKDHGHSVRCVAI